MKMSIPILLSLVFLTAQFAAAGIMFGVVTDEEGKPVKDAEVKIWGKEISTKTDAKGKFRIKSNKLIIGNRYSVKVKMEGFNSGQTFSTEIFEDEEDMEPMEVELYKEEALPEIDSASLSNNPYAQYLGSLSNMPTVKTAVEGEIGEEDAEKETSEEKPAVTPKTETEKKPDTTTK
jgi:hypothetical protein